MRPERRSPGGLVADRAASGATLVLAGDARPLPFAGGSFHAVVFAYNGLDSLASEEERLAALREVERVLAPVADRSRWPYIRLRQGSSVAPG